MAGTAQKPLTLLNLGSGPYVIEGFVNLDKKRGWTFESGLTQYGDGDVAAITISHALLYVPLGDWMFVFSEFARVLEPGGVVRITEDATDDPGSRRFGGYKGDGYEGDQPAVTLTTVALVRRHLVQAGLAAIHVDGVTTAFRDRRIIQRLHGNPPDVFHIEGVKPKP